MRKSFYLLAFLIFLGVALVSDVAADTITLSNGQSYTGEITAEEDDRVQIKLDGSGARLWFSRDNIESIETVEQEQDMEDAEEEESISENAEDTDDEDLDEDTRRAKELLRKMREQSGEITTNKKKKNKEMKKKKPVVADAAGEATDEEIDSLVHEMNNSPQPHKRIKAAKKLGEVGGERAIPHLIHALDDKAPSIRKAAIGSLKKITGTDFDYHPTAPRAVRLEFIKQWEKWWDEKQDREAMENLKQMF
jgi:hypothetical protein